MSKLSKRLKKGEYEVRYFDGLLLERPMGGFMLNTFMAHEMTLAPSRIPSNTIEKPLIILEYNLKMGGVNYVDMQFAP